MGKGGGEAGGGVTTNGHRVLRGCNDKLLEGTVAMAALL